MRNKHHRTTHKLGKRAFALCLALAVICSCLVPVFATGGIATMDGGFAIDTGFGVGGDDASFGVDPMDDAYGVDTGVDAGVDTGVDTGTDAGVDTGAGAVVVPPVVDDSSSTSTSGPTIITKETEYGTVTEYDWGDSQTTWTGEDAIVTPNDNMKEDDAAFGVLPIEYHFWLKQLDSFDFQMLAHEAEMAEMSETEYLALFGSSEQYPIWHMDTIASTDTISNYKFADPTAKDDPAGENHEFAYWYTVDENGVETEFDPYKTYGSETDTTVNVYAKWKDASGDVAQDTTKTEDTAKTESKTVEVSHKAVIEGTEDEVTITVKGLPENVKSLSVSSMGENSMDNFYELYAAQNGTMAPLFGFKIAPKDADGNTVQPKGPVTVTISGLSDEIMLSELAPFKVLHQVSDTDIETINASYNNGTLTFATDSFSPFVIASKNGYSASTLEAKASSSDVTVMVDATKEIQVSKKNGGKWSITEGNDKISLTSTTVRVNGRDYAVAYITGLATGTAKIEYSNWSSGESFTINVTDTRAAIYFLSSPDGVPASNDVQYWSPTTDQSALSASIDVSNATWDKLDGKDKNITSNVGSYILQWPDDKTSGASWTLTSEDKSPMVGGKTAFKYVLDSIWENYKTKIAQDLDVKVDTLSKDDISQITLNAFKISRNNSQTDGQFFHIDCTIDVVSKANFTAKFSVKYPGSEEYELVAAKNYKHDSKVDNSDIVDKKENGTVRVPSTMVRDGVTYQLTGWYSENATGGPYDESKQQSLKGSWGEGYTPTTEELADGTVNFYAYYEPVSADLTISKTVTGLLGDQHRAFTFQIVDKDGKPVALSADNIETSTEGLTEDDKAKVGLVGDGTEGKFTLVSGASITLKNLPSSEYKVIEESVTGYETSWKLGETDGSGTEAIVTVQDAAQTIAFTNHATLKPDTGVLLDTLPYIVILAVVVGGGILLMLRKRRKNDD